MTNDFKGIGHFTIWFLVGFVVFLLVKPRGNKHRSGLTLLALYSPFIPFVLGSVATIPYLLFVLGFNSHDQIISGSFNLFLLYGVLDQLEIFAALFSNFEMDAIVMAGAYLYLVGYYIGLVKRTRVHHAQ